ncbi:hypothetical protein HPB50_019300 [Hyalomma asiaticum]|uniref:Uncharacterized protein n=1 Tax=Hyalomma asiaticum TaxID=266040 RepID=A0ACB7RSV6_HYAAI|nr:hypothetical protein HPB50_019300 [Hyalomma asiaticum]
MRGYHTLRWTPPDSPRRILFLPNHACRHPKPETLSARSAPSPGVAAQRRPLFPSSCPGCPPEGQTISKEGLSDASWQTPGYRARERRRRELQNQDKPIVDPSASDHNARTAAPGPRHQVKPRPPLIHRRSPLPRLPQNTIHIVGRPRKPIDLAKVPPWPLHDALLKAASLPDQPPESRDRLRTHPTNNTFTLSVIDSHRARAYLRIKSIKALRVFNAFDDFSDDEILADLQASNSDMPVVSGRRMGQTRHIVVALMSETLHKWILYLGTDIKLYPLRCRHCDEEHSPPAEGEAPTCTPRCIVCRGAHNTGSSNCKYRFIIKKPPKPQVQQHVHEPASTTRRNPSRSGSCSSRSPSPRDRSTSFPPLEASDGQDNRYPVQLIAESADLAPTHVGRDPVQPFEPLQDPVRLAKALEQYLRG